MKKTLSVILAIMMLVQLCGLAVAETEDPTYAVIYTDPEGVRHDLTMTGELELTEDGEYLISEDVDNHGGVTTSGSASVTVEGNVTGYESGINAYQESEVHVTGDVTGGYMATYGDIVDSDGYAVYATGDATVKVDGSASSCGTGVVTMDQVYTGDQQTILHDDGSYEIHTQSIFDVNTADVFVKGDVTAEDDIGLNLSGESTVTVGGDVSGYDGMFLSDKVTVDVAGDVTGTEGTGIYTSNSIRSDETIDLYDENDEWCGVSPESKDVEYINHVKVNVGGDVTGGFAGIDARGASEISVGGNVSGGSDGTGAAVLAEGQVTVDIGGNVTSDGWAGVQVLPAWSDDASVLYDSDVKIRVDGNIETSCAALDVNAAAEITVAGNVTSDQATAINISEDGKSATVVIGGNVSGGTQEVTLPEIDDEELQQRIDALFTDVDVVVTDYVSGTLMVMDDQRPEAENRDADGQIVIQGSLNAQGDNAAYTVDLYIEEGAEAELPEIPTLTVYEMNVEDGDYIGLNVNEYVERPMGDSIEAKILTVDPGEEKKTELVNAIAATIQYIIKITQPENGTIDMTGAEHDELSGQMVAHEGDDLSLTVKVDDGYYVQDVAAGAKALVSNAGNGVWTVTVQRGGGVTISAKVALCAHEKWDVLSRKEPTCTEDGSETRQCQVCKKQETVTLKALEHEFAETFTANNDGTHSAKCLHDGCTETLTQPCEMETTETADTRTSVCKVCSYTVTETVEKESETENTPATDPTENNPETDPTENNPETKPTENDPETAPTENQNAGAPIQSSEQELQKVPVQGAVFEVVDGDENLPPLEGELNVSVLVPDAESVYQVGPFVLTSDQIVFLDITLTHEGNAVRLDRKIRISFPVTEELIEKIKGKALCIFTEEGNIIRIDYEIIDGKIVFETDVINAVIFIDEAAFMQPEETPETPVIMGYNESISEPVPMQANDENGLKSINDESASAWPSILKYQVNLPTGWQLIDGVWYFLDPSKGGKAQPGGVTPDGWTVDETGARGGSIFLDGGKAQPGGVTPDGRTGDATGAWGGSIPQK